MEGGEPGWAPLVALTSLIACVVVVVMMVVVAVKSFI
jgi:hypothetical protein